MKTRSLLYPELERRPIVSVLVVEDTPSDAALIRSYLEDVEGYSYNVRMAADLQTALRILATEEVQAILLDLFLPDTEGLSGLQAIKFANMHAPIVILTGRDDGLLALHSVETGAQDYLLKEQVSPATLSRAIQYAIQRKRFEERVLREARFDPLTNLPNRLQFMEKLRQALSRQQRYGTKLAVLMIDLDGFKAVNDSYGHAMGDALLKEIGDRLLRCIRESDAASRFGGDEFFVLAEHITGETESFLIASKLQTRISLPFPCNGHRLQVGSSVGIAFAAPGAGSAPEALLQRADEAMYDAKRSGKNTCHFWGVS